MSQGPPPTLAAFLQKANVRIEKSDNNNNMGEFAQFVNNNNNNYDAIVANDTNIKTSDLRYTNFIAEVGPIARPDVLNFVRKTKPLQINGNFNTREISGYYGQFQKGVTHTNLYGFKVHQNLDPAQLKNQTWTFIEFRVAVKGKKMIIARMYKDKMVIQGGCVDNDPETPLKVGRYIVNKYLGQNSADLTLKFASLDASFQVNGTIQPRVLSEALTKNSIDHTYEQQLKASDVRQIKYEGEVIDSVTINGFITLHKKSVAQIKRAYKAALKFVERLKTRGLITPTNTFAPIMEKNLEPAPTRVRIPRVRKLTNTSNTLLNDKMCSKYSLDELKQICKAMGIFAKKTWKKKDMCEAIFQKSSNAALERVFNNNKKKNNTNNKLSKNRGIDNASIRGMITNAYGPGFKTGRNANADLRVVKNGMKSMKTNKKGVPFKGEVVKLVKDVVRERKLRTFLNTHDANIRPLIRRRIKTVTKKAVDDEAKKLKQLKLTKNNLNMLKNKNIKPNVNLKTYTRQRRLALDYIRLVVLRQSDRNAVRQSMNAWFSAQNKSPDDDALKRRLARTIRELVDPTMNVATMTGLYARRMKRS